MATTLPLDTDLTSFYAEVEYPESDGQPLAETDVHIQLLFDLRGMLTQHFASEPDVYVSGNNFLYYQEGDPHQVVSPDSYVVRGLARAKEPRRTYRLWVEGKAPDWVLEATSDSTRLQDIGAKKGLYEAMGVQEYVLFDPLGDYLAPPLQGYQLRNGHFEPQARTPEGGLYSEALRLELRFEDERLRLYDPTAGRYLLSPDELSAALRAEEAARQAAEAERATEAQARAAAEAEVARLRAELERLRGRSGG
jgi:Uma2 family endonuclease